jgi:hypothetical protein
LFKRKTTGQEWWYTPINSTVSWKAEAGGLQVQGQPGLHNETLFQKQERKGAGGTTERMRLQVRNILMSAQKEAEPISSPGRRKSQMVLSCTGKNLHVYI